MPRLWAVSLASPSGTRSCRRSPPMQSYGAGLDERMPLERRLIHDSDVPGWIVAVRAEFSRRSVREDIHVQQSAVQRSVRLQHVDEVTPAHNDRVEFGLVLLVVTRDAETKRPKRFQHSSLKAPVDRRELPLRPWRPHLPLRPLGARRSGPIPVDRSLVQTAGLPVRENTKQSRALPDAA